MQLKIVTKNTIISSVLVSFIFTTINCDGIVYPVASIKVNEMLKIDGGTFMMGSDRLDEKNNGSPAHKVTLGNFSLSKYDITQNEYSNLMLNNPSLTTKYREPILDEFGYKIGKYKPDKSPDNLPVENVSWFDAIKYCNVRSKNEKIPLAYNELTGDLLDENGLVTTNIRKVKGYRLPTESEWEYAARGGNKSHGYIYSGSNNVNEVAWYQIKGPQEVGTKKPNELGLYDMTGNVYQWCTDWFTDYSTDSVTEPYISNSHESLKILKLASRVMRGGSWYADLTEGIGIKVYTRFFSTPESSGSSNNIGFRIAKTLT